MLLGPLVLLKDGLMDRKKKKRESNWHLDVQVPENTTKISCIENTDHLVGMELQSEMAERTSQSWSFRDTETGKKEGFS